MLLHGHCSCFFYCAANFWHRYAPDSPEGQRAGQDLAGGYFACLFALCNDLDAGYKFLGLPNWSRHENLCALCPCTFRGRLTWKNNASDAPWLSSCFTPETWRQQENRSMCRLFDLPGASACIVALDYMHSKYLGSLQYIYMDLSSGYLYTGSWLMSLRSIFEPLHLSLKLFSRGLRSHAGMGKIWSSSPCSREENNFLSSGARLGSFDTWAMRS